MEEQYSSFIQNVNSVVVKVKLFVLVGGDIFVVIMQLMLSVLIKVFDSMILMVK